MKQHELEALNSKCKHCQATYEQVMDGISCGQIRCSECTLLRVCYSGTCEECRENISKTKTSCWTETMNIDGIEKPFDAWAKEYLTARTKDS